MEFIKKKRNIESTKKDKRLKLNVGGVYFETLTSTLENIGGSRLALLAQLQEGDDSWDPEKQEYFFDRHPGVFMSVIHYYRTDELHIDQNLCGNIIQGVGFQ
ncbi:hypothetical protein ACJMK2_044189 [Sinanodonta woodiana]|uniref:Potassium channel tetramerisation-type BTB domain-containing protein n=1 Tax=Sinanodonta woodiana TaxID=1069815 RepID=A0ABD3VZA0_SINWO